MCVMIVRDLLAHTRSLRMRFHIHGALFRSICTHTHKYRTRIIDWHENVPVSIRSRSDNNDDDTQTRTWMIQMIHILYKMHMHMNARANLKRVRFGRSSTTIPLPISTDTCVSHMCAHLSFSFPLLHTRNLLSTTIWTIVRARTAGKCAESVCSAPHYTSTIRAATSTPWMREQTNPQNSHHRCSGLAFFAQPSHNFLWQLNETYGTTQCAHWKCRQVCCPI